MSARRAFEAILIVLATTVFMYLLEMVVGRTWSSVIPYYLSQFSPTMSTDWQRILGNWMLEFGWFSRVGTILIIATLIWGVKYTFFEHSYTREDRY